MATKILITGGSGLVGSVLTDLLLENGYAVAHLSRHPDPGAKVPTFMWDIRNGQIDEEALRGTEYIVHLAGATVSKRWTPAYKKKIIDSRVQSAEFLHKQVKKLGVPLKAFISASGISFYGADTGTAWVNEETPAGSDFLSAVTVKWEAAADLFQSLTRVVKFRIGVVLSEKGGALPPLARPVRWMVGAPVGTGDQFMSWIHIHDLARMIYFAIEKPLEGVYNAVGSGPVTNKQLTEIIAEVLHRPLWMPKVPAFLLRMVFGEMSQIITGGNRVNNRKIVESGFEFEYKEARQAVKDLLSR